MSRAMPTECVHGVTVDWGDFGPCQNCDNHPDVECPNLADCPACDTYAVNPIDAKIAAHLAYLDSNAAACTSNANLFKGSVWSTRMGIAADVYEEVAAELRHTLGIETP